MSENCLQQNGLTGRVLDTLRRLFLVAASLLVMATAGAASLTASLEPTTIAIGETAVLSLTFTGGEPTALPNLAAIPGITATHAGRSSQMTIVNGQVSSSVTHTYQLTARQAGTITIPALEARVGNERLTTQPLRLNVVQPGAAAPGGTGEGNPLILLRLRLPKTEVFVGELILAELQLLLRPDVQSVDSFQLSAFPMEGFTAGKMVEGQRRGAQVGGQQYTLIPLYVPLKALRAGSYTVGPASVVVDVQIPRARRSRNIFDFGIMGGERRRASLGTDPVEIKVLPLPAENVPPGFAGAVGVFTLDVHVSPTNVAVGDPITVRAEIAGRGDFDALTLPEQAGWKEFKTYPATAQVELDGLGTQGKKTFEQVVVPEKPDLTLLPGLVFSYFDPDKRAYEQLAAADVPLVVRPVGAPSLPTVAPQAGNTGAGSPQARDILHIKPRLGVLASTEAPLLMRPWFVALQLVPVAVLLVSVVLRKRAEAFATNPRLRRRKHVAEVVRAGLQDLRAHAAANDSEKFFATMLRLLQEQIGERLDMPATAITEAVVEDHLKPRGCPEPLRIEIAALFEAGNLARYAPVRSSEQLTAFIPKVEAVLEQLRNFQA